MHNYLPRTELRDFRWQSISENAVFTLLLKQRESASTAQALYAIPVIGSVGPANPADWKRVTNGA